MCHAAEARSSCVPYGGLSGRAALPHPPRSAAFASPGPFFSPQSYSTECVEWMFCELRLYGVLRSSVHSSCSAKLCDMAHIHSLRTQVCCIHRVAQLTPCEGDQTQGRGFEPRPTEEMG